MSETFFNWFCRQGSRWKQSVD